MTYVPLWVKSNGSFLEGASHPEELVERAHDLGLAGIALTDRDGVYGLVKAHVRAQELGMEVVCGAQVTVEDGARVLLLAEDRAGWGHLCRLLTAGRRRCEKGSSRVRWDEVLQHNAGLSVLWGHALGLGHAGEQAVARLAEAFSGRAFALIARHEAAGEERAEAATRALATRLATPLAAACETLYHDVARRPLQDVLTAVRHRVPLTEAGTLLKPNASHVLLAPEAFARRFADAPEAVRRTREIFARCPFRLKDLRYTYPPEDLPPGVTAREHLRALTLEGARARYGGEAPPGVRAQIEKELTLIEELDYGGYFLTMHDLVRFCREREILCQGRGSAANSAVCYCLGVTAVDPVRMGFLFERFLSRERAEPPDIDLDIMHERREEVIQYLYARKGRDHAAMVANVIRYRPRSAVRDAGKALGLPMAALDRLAKLLGWHGPLARHALEEAGLDPQLPAVKLLFELVNEMIDFPRHLSIHPGGFLLGHDPVITLVPVENATMEDRTVIQWDKDDIESLGFFKVDLLGLGGLTQLDLCFRLLKKHRGLDLDMARLPPADGATFDAIGRGDTVGVFQIESRAQMAMLPRLRPRNFYDLVIEISIIRPGPIAGGMLHPYLRRRQGTEEVTYPHPALEPVLKKTLGVPLFQEQVMRIAMVAADYTPGEADQLRRDMAAWRRGGRLERHYDRLVGRMVEKGVTRDMAERVFEQVKGFGEYGFPESHAASFALISYAAAYLKTHYPAEFACTLINAQPMGFYPISTITDDARRHGVEVRPVCVAHSDWDCTLEDEGERRKGKGERQPGVAQKPLPFALRMGMRCLEGFREEEARHIESARALAPFRDMDDLVRRTGIQLRSLLTLARAGAFAAWGLTRRDALWAARRAGRTRPEMDLPDTLPPPALTPLTRHEAIAWDWNHAGHSTLGHPVAALRERLQDGRFLSAAEVAAKRNGRVRAAGLVICRQRPSTAKGTVFLTLEDETGFVNVILWPQVFEEFSTLVKTETLLGIEGHIQSQDGVTHLIALRVLVPSLRVAHPVRSHDFR